MYTFLNSRHALLHTVSYILKILSFFKNFFSTLPLSGYSASVASPAFVCLLRFFSRLFLLLLFFHWWHWRLTLSLWLWHEELHNEDDVGQAPDHKEGVDHKSEWNIKAVTAVHCLWLVCTRFTEMVLHIPSFDKKKFSRARTPKWDLGVLE